MKIDHRIMVAIHIPVKEMPRQRSDELMARARKAYSGVFPKDYIVMFFPHKLDEEKVIIEVMNTEDIHADLEKFEEIRAKFEEMRNLSDSMKVVTKFKL